ncbi:hypothetical protein HSBAA_17540 [Vreelandella sulfidaeris]|uniref:Uncharacterized protein n=1 Tax=Vreelandella sulfidaeris TaxID=115553 RepID=A0A455U872_9GAMM|nr:hypothetical protein HSBAA_17540 [Halomonas sulfidaeris]
MLGADKIATGHYVRQGMREGSPRLLKGLDGNKDQSYFLHAVPEAAIARTLFPVGELEKPAVRALAEQYELITAKKKIPPASVLSANGAFATSCSSTCPPSPAKSKHLKVM